MKGKQQDLYNSNWVNLDGNWIHITAIVHDNVIMGKGNVVGPYTIIGGNGEIRGKNQLDFKGHVEIGNDNVISELVTIQRPYDEGAVTKIGSNCIITAHSHIGHDVTVGDNVEVCYSILGGYSTVKSGAKIKMNCTIRNRRTVGENAVVGMGSVVVKDVEANTVVMGNPAKTKK